MKMIPVSAMSNFPIRISKIQNHYMPFIKTEIPGLIIFEPKVFADDRGYFYESYTKPVFEAGGITCNFIQDNRARSVYGVIRGLHYQLNPHAQSKLISVMEGTILDVAVDIRTGSPTFGKVFSIELSAENKKQLFIPAGFAHGYSVLSTVSEVMYKVDETYHKESEGGIIYNDPSLSIDWKVPQQNHVLSPKDLVHPLLKDCRNNFEFTS